MLLIRSRVKSNTNSIRNLLEKLNTIHGFSGTINQHHFSLCVRDIESTPKKIVIQPRKFYCMMTNSISETLSSDKFDAFLIILKYSTWFDRWKTKSTEKRLQNGTFEGSAMKGHEFSTAGVKGSYRLLFYNSN